MKTTGKPDWLVFTDLDGTLLDHDTYDWSPAEPALRRLQANAIPVVPVSSKTLAELEPLCRELGLHGPTIAENGAVVAIPGERPDITEPDYAAIRKLLHYARDRFGWGFTGFGDMTPEAVADATGLAPQQAVLATRRLASEPITWQGSEDQFAAFARYLAGQDLQTLQGGRFMHVLGRTDKGRALQQVVCKTNPQARTIALGDSPNDQAMLQVADFPIIIRRKHAGHMKWNARVDAVRTQEAGPQGWNQAVCELLDQQGI